MKTFKNIHFTKRDYEATNVVACRAPSAPDANWIECNESELDGLSQLWRQGEVVYFGWL